MKTSVTLEIFDLVMVTYQEVLYKCFSTILKWPNYFETAVRSCANLQVKPSDCGREG